MALYSPQQAELDGIKGQGYAFSRRTYQGIEYRGVFFVDEEKAEALEPLLEKDEVEFTGVVYKKNRSGKVRQMTRTFLVDVKDLASVHVGERADFKVVGEA
ncbi:hypothetical protein GQ464_007030 [Rhodocaloribacter litoris]|uniref:hypothetical protein n=1 Tax=Rhodocaloribacter litoris TaxID=2558931 RepID=UPI001423DD40|nr:hypothetical protein [Rhodocaloribacter litoris]QXD16685.1 hypothetical protein GQ464_007030 [Rhodocaloribacter litoris]GIV59317.1 MAG: hypothetical protein KatS3mg043_0406 [Rhodothermaceae bacterium]